MITLRDRVTWTMPETHPGLGGLFVIGRHRGRGIWTERVRAGMHLARDQGYESVYAITVTARGILEGLGWKMVHPVTQSNERGMLYRCEFK